MTVVIAEQRPEQVRLVEDQFEPGAAFKRLIIVIGGGEIAFGHQAATC